MYGLAIHIYTSWTLLNSPLIDVKETRETNFKNGR